VFGAGGVVSHGSWSNHDVTRIASRLNDQRHLAHALAVLTTVGGTPAVYAGDEHAFRGTKEDRAGGEDAVRPPFPPTLEDMSPLGVPVFAQHQELLGLRLRHPWLHHAHTRVLDVADEYIALASTADGERVVTVLSTADHPQTVAAAGVRDVLAGTARIDHPGNQNAQVIVEAHGWAVLSS